MCFIQSPFDFENPQPLPSGFLALVLALCSSHSLCWPVFSAVVWWEGSMWYPLVPLLILCQRFFVPCLRVFFGSFLSIKVLSCPLLPSLEHCVPSILSVWLPLFAIAHLFWICLCILIIFVLPVFGFLVFLLAVAAVLLPSNSVVVLVFALPLTDPEAPIFPIFCCCCHCFAPLDLCLLWFVCRLQGAIGGWLCQFRLWGRPMCTPIK